MNLGLMFTARCNVKCGHCSTDCGPSRSEELSLDQMKHVLDQASSIKDGVRFNVCISGGEPFLNFKQLIAVIRHAKTGGAYVSCVTNASWATSMERAVDLMRQLADAGLDEIGISASHFHLKWILLDRVKRAVDAARLVGVSSVLKCGLLKSDRIVDGKPDWLHDITADSIDLFAIVPPGRPGEQLDSSELMLMPGIPQGRCPSREMSVAEDGLAYVCCSSARLNSFHALGSTDTESIDELYRKLALAGKHRLLREQGPSALAAEISRQGHADRLRPDYVSVCDLCSHIAHDAVMASIAEELGKDRESDVLKAALVELLAVSGGAVKAPSSVVPQ